MSYRGSLTCLAMWNISAEIDACASIANCSAIGPLPVKTFAVSI